MTIHNATRYVNALWDWGFLDDCFQGTHIRVSDIDGIVERNGRFLVIETKGVEVELPRGQEIMLAHLARNGFTVLVIWGNANHPYQMQVWYPGKAKPEPLQPASEADVQEIVRRWFNWANTQRTLI